MPVHNADIAEIFNRIADLLDIQGANPFRIRAYRTAARTIAELPRSAADMVERGEDLCELPGIGKDLAGKIKEIVETGTLAQLEELKKTTPMELADLMIISDLGPKRVLALYKELNIKTLEDLREAVKQEKIRRLRGFGKKTEEKIAESLEKLAAAGKRFKLIEVEDLVKALVERLKRVPGAEEVIAAGSFRRRMETVGDIDILATCKRGSPLMDAFVNYEDVREVVSHGDTRSTVVLRSGLQVDLRVVDQESYGAALHYFTGSKAHNIAIRKMGVKKGLKINEYGVFKDDKRVSGKKEEEVFAAVDLPYIVPELRENRGEIEAAQQGRLPQLITLEDIRGDLHAHTKVTDGRNTMEEMAAAAEERGYAYLAISNHSKRVTMAKGLDAEGLAREIEKIDSFNAQSRGIILLKAIEVDILEDGSLDLPDDILKELDVVIGAVHYNLNLPREKMTARIIKAMDNPCFHILAHPTDRIINRRPPLDVDVEALLKAAKERGCFMELDAQPDRLDLSDVYCKLAKDMGVKIAISTDAHSTAEFDFMRFGVGQARRGWLEPEDVLNTRTWPQLKKLLHRK
ncbi:MAG: DNA polymerase/3'-5' exonuclease PolX [Deltaproteobacteria bacterium]|nr:DNA polymerase/3'-5' exonuclease PolX [Deltaproteobacteria bacterium]